MRLAVRATHDLFVVTVSRNNDLILHTVVTHRWDPRPCAACNDTGRTPACLTMASHWSEYQSGPIGQQVSSTATIASGFTATSPNDSTRLSRHARNRRILTTDQKVRGSNPFGRAHFPGSDTLSPRRPRISRG